MNNQQFEIRRKILIELINELDMRVEKGDICPFQATTILKEQWKLLLGFDLDLFPFLN